MEDKEKLYSQLKNEPEVMRILQNKEKLSSILSSDEGRRLIAILSSGGGETLKMAATAISSGNADEAKRILEPLMAKPETAAIVEELGKKAKNE